LGPFLYDKTIDSKCISFRIRNMDSIREFFYWTASIALILIGIFIIGLIALLAYIKRLADRSMRKLDESLEHVQSATRTWRNLAFTRVIIRALRYIL